MKIDLKNFIEGNDNLFMLTNYKEAESILNDFINYYESEKLKLCEVVLQSEQYCGHYKDKCIKDFCSISNDWQKCKYLKQQY